MKYVHRPTLVDATFDKETDEWEITYPSGCTHRISNELFNRLYFAWF